MFDKWKKAKSAVRAPQPGDPKLELYYYDACPFCLMVLNQIEQLGLGNIIELKHTIKTPEYRQELQSVTGRTQVPCLFIGGKPMFESSDINEYLQETFGE